MALDGRQSGWHVLVTWVAVLGVRGLCSAVVPLHLVWGTRAAAVCGARRVRPPSRPSHPPLPFDAAWRLPVSDCYRVICDG